MQSNFLGELGITSEAALLAHKLAPLAVRRDIAMLGLLHRIVLGLAPEPFESLIWPEPLPNNPRGWRLRRCRHSRQLHDPLATCRHRVLERSIFGLIHTYNLLPQHVVDSLSVKTFQRKLQGAVRNLVERDTLVWPTFLKSGVRRMSAEAFQTAFSI